MDLEALRLSLTSLDVNTTNDKLEVDHTKESQEQEERLLHQQKMGECRGHWCLSAINNF